jgi:hypothetical protein
MVSTGEVRSARSPAQVRGDSADLRKLQDLLAGALGVPLAWPDDIRRGAGLRDDG